MSGKYSVAQIERLESRRLLAVTPVPADKFVITDPENGNLIITDTSGNTKTTIASQSDNPQDASFSPDRTKILFDGHGSNVDSTYEIFTINVDGTGFQRLITNTSKDYEPSYSPDGSKIVFISARDGNDELYVMNADGSNPVRLTSNSATEADPSFSPDGSKILFDSDSTGKSQIYTVDAATGGNLKRLVNDAQSDTEPRYSPAGGRIVFDSYVPFDNSHSGGVYITNIAPDGSASTPVQLTEDGLTSGNFSPSFSPDGSKLATSFSRPVSGGDIQVLNADNGTLVNEFELTGFAESVSWASAPAFAEIANRVLKVNGTAGNDQISIANDGMTLTITLNGNSEPFSIDDFSSLQIFAGDGNDVVDGSHGDIAFYASGDAGDDELIGGIFNDTLTAGAGRNTLFGGDGDDRLNGSGGRDFLYGENGNDREYGNGGNDYMVGGAGVDRMWGGDGDDLLSGNTGNDKMYGEAGNDQLIGGDGNDIVYGGPGIDTLNGQKGTDSSDGDPQDLLASIEIHP